MSYPLPTTGTPPSPSPEQHSPPPSIHTPQSQETTHLPALQGLTGRSNNVGVRVCHLCSSEICKYSIFRDLLFLASCLPLIWVEKYTDAIHVSYSLPICLPSPPCPAKPVPSLQKIKAAGSPVWRSCKHRENLSNSSQHLRKYCIHTNMELLSS